MDHDMEQIRATAHVLAERAWKEQTFREQIEADPVGALTAAGLPEEFVSSFLYEAQLGEVSGYEMEQKCQLSLIEFIQDFIY